MFEYILLALLFAASIFLIVAVTIQKSGDEGLSGTIAGGSDTYYGRDKSKQSGKRLNKWTLIIAAVFVAVVLVVYVVQPDYMNDLSDPESWKDIIKITGWSIFN
jgi:preprotein translocase subunit SecG